MSRPHDTPSPRRKPGRGPRDEVTGPPEPDSYGTLGGFGEPHPIRPGACPTCGAIPPCEVPRP